MMMLRVMMIMNQDAQLRAKTKEITLRTEPLGQDRWYSAQLLPVVEVPCLLCEGVVDIGAWVHTRIEFLSSGPHLQQV